MQQLLARSSTVQPYCCKISLSLCLSLSVSVSVCVSLSLSSRRPRDKESYPELSLALSGSYLDLSWAPARNLVVQPARAANRGPDGLALTWCIFLSFAQHLGKDIPGELIILSKQLIPDNCLETCLIRPRVIPDKLKRFIPFDVFFIPSYPESYPGI